MCKRARPGPCHTGGMSNIQALAIVNQALSTLGEAPIDSFEGQTTPQVVANLRYQPVVDQMLGSHPWWWSREIKPLARLAVAPSAATGFSAAYQLPPLMFKAVVPYIRGLPESDWGLAGAALLIDADVGDTVELEYHTRVSEERFSPTFAQALVSTLAMEMCMALTESETRWKLLKIQAEWDLRVARYTNASEKPAMRLPTGGLQARMRR